MSQLDEPVSLAARLERVEAILRAAKMHEPDCPADHNCSRDHPEAAVYHYPQPCVCWLAPTGPCNDYKPDGDGGCHNCVYSHREPERAECPYCHNTIDVRAGRYEHHTVVGGPCSGSRQIIQS